MRMLWKICLPIIVCCAIIALNIMLFGEMNVVSFVSGIISVAIVKVINVLYDE